MKETMNNEMEISMNMLEQVTGGAAILPGPMISAILPGPMIFDPIDIPIEPKVIQGCHTHTDPYLGYTWLCFEEHVPSETL